LQWLKVYLHCIRTTMQEGIQLMTETQELVRRLNQHSTNSLAKASGLARPTIADIKSGKAKDMRLGTFERLRKAVDGLDQTKPAAITPKPSATEKAAPKRRSARGSAGTAHKASRSPKAGAGK
jgi:DNA-binding Xre family transcriptional regulator